MGNTAEKLEPSNDTEKQPMASAKPVDNSAELKRLREFGVLMGFVLTVVSAFLFWKERPATVWVLIAALFFITTAFLTPHLLRPIEKGWLWFGERMSIVMTFLLLTLTYYLVMTPIGLLLKLIRKDILDLKLDKNASSYWKKVEEDGPHTRPYLPY